MIAIGATIILVLASPKVGLSLLDESVPLVPVNIMWVVR
jgi:hypothetical protein